MSPLEKNQQLKYTDYWRSLGELKDAPEYREFLEAEFPSAEDPEGISRRRWLQLMGASLTLASVAACRWEKREILPFDKRPANRTPGKFEHYTTARDMGGTALGLLVTCIDGRPIKIEGNPKHPYSLGATDAHAQAAILELYDPDRSKNIILKTDRDDMVKTWEEFAAFVGSHFHDLRKNGGRGFAVLAETSTSPTLAALQKRLQAVLPQSIWLQYEPIANEFGDIRTHLFLDKAEVIVCLDADLFGSHPAAVKLARDFAVGREVKDGKMNRLYVVESCFSITGAMADHRLPMRSTAIAPFAKMLLQALETQMNQTSPGASPASHIDVMAKDLLAHKGKSVVVVGAGQPKEVELIARQINQRLDNVGRTVHYTETPVVAQQQQISGLESLVADMTSGKISTLLVLGGNPVYNSPADINFAQALQNVTTSIHLSNYRNETSLGCTWHLPQAHFLESWGDARAFDGSYSIIQPMIEPLHGGKSAIELLAMILEEKSSAYDLVRASFKEISKTDDLEKHWPAALREGFVTGSLLKEREIQPDVDLSKIGDSLASALENGHLEIVFRPSSALYDGRFANNGWLQEMPDPLTRVTWDNAAVMSPKTAERLGVTDNTLVKLKFQGREAEIPVYILPGQADGSVAVALGYGRTAAGLVGGSTSDDIPSVGVDVYRMRTSKSMNFSPGLSVEPTGKTYRLATVEDHFAIDRVGMEGRAERAGELIREATLEDFLKHPDFAKSAVEHPPLQSLWDEHKFEEHRWAMTIDLAKCTGCGACVIACMSENNVPVVGRDRVLRNREMHWIRIDRHFRGDVDNPQVVLQPVACHQCELAPCEAVCPVAATVHSKEGLNDMVYNRCVGTRYCANNCPYKVRRFNFFNYHKQFDDPNNEILKMAHNPQVTVRSRGVMEKCTYCVQRIQAVKIEAKNNRRQIEDGEIKTACQQVCPVEAIIFGDMSDKNSAVAKNKEQDRAYEMLGELNVKPRTSYLARIRNPNPDWMDKLSS